MKVVNEAKIIKHVIEITNKDTQEKSFLCMDGDEWKTISKEEYKKIVGE